MSPTQFSFLYKTYHKCDVFILHIFPTLFKELYDLDAFTFHPKIVNSSTKVNKNTNRFQKYYRTRLSLLHVKPIEFKDFGRIWG